MIKRIPISEIFKPENYHFLRSYSDECSIPEIGQAIPDPVVYESLEGAGVQACFGAYSEDGDLVGLASVLTTVMPHYSKPVATVESLYVLPDFRNLFGTLLMAQIEEYAREKGCAAILYSAPTGGRFERLLDCKKAYRRTNAVFCRSLA